MSINKDDIGGFINEMVEQHGVSCSTVKDGHVLVFKTSWLKKVLEQHANKDRITMFLQRPDFGN